MSKLILIDGTEYRVALVKLKRKADILDKSAHRDEYGILHREVIGTYYNYELQIGTVNNPALYEQLFEVLSAPVPSHIVELPNDHVAFEGYFSSIADEVLRVTDEGTIYKGLSCRLTATRPRKTP